MSSTTPVRAADLKKSLNVLFKIDGIIINQLVKEYNKLVKEHNKLVAEAKTGTTHELISLDNIEFEYDNKKLKWASEHKKMVGSALEVLTKPKGLTKGKTEKKEAGVDRYYIANPEVARVIFENIAVSVNEVRGLRNLSAEVADTADALADAIAEVLDGKYDGKPVYANNFLMQALNFLTMYHPKYAVDPKELAEKYDADAVYGVISGELLNDVLGESDAFETYKRQKLETAKDKEAERIRDGVLAESARMMVVTAYLGNLLKDGIYQRKENTSKKDTATLKQLTSQIDAAGAADNFSAQVEFLRRMDDLKAMKEEAKKAAKRS